MKAISAASAGSHLAAAGGPSGFEIPGPADSSLPPAGPSPSGYPVALALKSPATDRLCFQSGRVLSAGRRPRLPPTNRPLRPILSRRFANRGAGGVRRELEGGTLTPRPPRVRAWWVFKNRTSNPGPLLPAAGLARPNFWPFATNRVPRTSCARLQVSMGGRWLISGRTIQRNRSVSLRVRVAEFGNGGRRSKSPLLAVAETVRCPSTRAAAVCDSVFLRSLWPARPNFWPFVSNRVPRTPCAPPGFCRRFSAPGRRLVVCLP